MLDMSIKCGCSRAFIAKQLYLGAKFLSTNIKHKNKQGQICQKINVHEYCHALVLNI
jgi:hypothetical protein